MKRHELIPVPEEAIADLRSRLERFRRVPLPQRDGLGGVDPEVLSDLLRHWADDYDWREHERRIASWPWVQTEHTAVPIRAIVRPADREDAPVVLLLHGWRTRCSVSSASCPCSVT